MQQEGKMACMARQNLKLVEFEKCKDLKRRENNCPWGNGNYTIHFLDMVQILNQLQLQPKYGVLVARPD